MATKKKTFDAVVESRRWRTEVGIRRSAMTPTERRDHLRRTTVVAHTETAFLCRSRRS